MGFKIIVSTVSQIEIREAVDWYESKQSGLGVRFAEEAQEIFYRLIQNPQHYTYAKYNSGRFASLPFRIKCISR